MSSYFLTDSTRWRAIQSRDPAATNSFIYAVLTTRIYCRPTCPARLARRANIAFYDTASQAAAAGFRACKRCKPESGTGLPEDAAIKAVREFVDGKGKAGSLGEMATRAGLSKWHFHRTFVKVVGITPGEWVRRRRAEEKGEGVSSSNSSSEMADSEDCEVGDLSPDLELDISEEEWEKLICFDGMSEKGEEWERWLNI